MTGTEQIYALFVQANPVPDPAELPLTLETPAPLLSSIEERNGIMLTEERSHVEEPQQKKRWLSPALAMSLAFVVVVGAGLLVWLAMGDDVVAAADADPKVVFDGDVVVYEGPTNIEVGSAEFTVTNDATELAYLAIWRFASQSALDAELARQPLGTDMALEPTDPEPAGAMQITNIGAPAGFERGEEVLLAPGLHVIDVVTATNLGVIDHVWRADVIIEVVP